MNELLPNGGEQEPVQVNEDHVIEDADNTEDPLTLENQPVDYVSPEVRGVGKGALAELTLGNCSSGIPDANSQYNWG